MVLCLFIFIGWMWLSQKIWPPAKPPPPSKKPEAAVPAPKPPEKPEPDKTEPRKIEPPTPPAEPSRYAEKPTRLLSSKLLDAEMTNVGAGVRRLSLHFPKE